MLLTAYFLNHGHFTVIPHQLKENFDDMVSSGFDAAAISFTESEMVYSRRAFEIQVALAHEAGLKVFLIPSRLGNRFAGAPLMPSLWLAGHPEAQVPGHIAWNGPLACMESRVFRDWMKGFLGTVVRDYPLDGIIWDEPKDVDFVSRHPETLAKFGPDPTSEQMAEGFLDFLVEINAHCVEINPALQITLFNEATTNSHFTACCGRDPNLHFLGYDGNLARQSFFHEEPEWRKYRLESVWERTKGECAATGKGTFALVENMLMPKAAIPEYERNLDAYLATHRPDHLAFYYYAHNNEDPETVHQITRDAIKKHLRS